MEATRRKGAAGAGDQGTHGPGSERQKRARKLCPEYEATGMCTRIKCLHIHQGDNVYSVDSSMSPAELRVYQVRRALAHVSERSDESTPYLKRTCRKCWVQVRYCICERLAEVARGTPAPSASLVIYLHHKEFGRASNSGKLGWMVLGGASAEMLIHDVPEDDLRLEKRAREAWPFVCALYPTDDSLSIPAFIAAANRIHSSGPRPGPWEDSDNVFPTSKDGESASSRPPHDGEDGSQATELARKPLVILLDATWPQARRMMHRIPEWIPRVKLSPFSLSNFTVRSQSQADRISTIEAASMMLGELGEQPEIMEGLGRALEVLNEANLDQSHRNTDLFKEKKRAKTERRLKNSVEPRSSTDHDA